MDGNQQEQDVRIVYGRRDETDSNQHESSMTCAGSRGIDIHVESVIDLLA